MDIRDLLRQMTALMAAIADGADGAESEEIDALRDQVAGLGANVSGDLEALLVDSDEDVAFQAARVLERMGEPGAFDAAVGYYLAHADEVDGRAEPIWFQRLLALGARVLPLVEERLDRGAPAHERLSAVNVLALVAGTAAVARLAELTADPDERVAQTAAEALGRVGDRQALATLLALLDHPSANVRYGAIEGLDLIGDASVVGRLVDVVENDPAPVVAWWPSPAAGELTVAGRAESLVAQFAGRFFDGDVAQMRAWVAEHTREH